MNQHATILMSSMQHKFSIPARADATFTSIPRKGYGSGASPRGLRMSGLWSRVSFAGGTSGTRKDNTRDVGLVGVRIGGGPTRAGNVRGLESPVPFFEEIQAANVPFVFAWSACG